MQVPRGFHIVRREVWSADREPRSLTARSRRGINTIYLHWPAVSGNLRDRDNELQVPEQEATDSCWITADMMEWLDDINEATVDPRSRVDTAAEERAFMRRIRDFHMDERGWQYFAYNHGMFLSGRVYQGRGIDNIPAAQAPHNTDGLAICVMMGTADRVTRAVRSQLKDYVRWSERTCNRDQRVRGHGEVNSTSCPGPRLQSMAAGLSRL